MPLMRTIYYTSHNVKRFYRPRTNVSPKGSAHSPHLSRLIHRMHCSQTHTHIFLERAEPQAPHLEAFIEHVLG